MSEPIELPHIDRIDYVGGSYPMAIKPGGEYVDYDDHVAIVRQLAEQRAELLEALRRAADTVERDDLDTPICCDGRDCGCMGSSSRQLFVHDLRALVERIANATQQRKEPGA